MVCEGDNVKSRHLNINHNFLFGLAQQKAVRDHLTRLNALTQTEKEILSFYNDGHISICQVKFAVALKNISQNSTPARDLQRPRAYVTHDDVTYPIIY